MARPPIILTVVAGVDPRVEMALINTPFSVNRCTFRDVRHLGRNKKL
jgi:hypothetical protein